MAASKSTGFWMMIAALLLAPAQFALAQAATQPSASAAPGLLAFDDAPVGVVLGYFAQQYNITFVPEVPVTGSMTLSTTRPAGPDEAAAILQPALRQKGFDMQRQADRVFTIDSADHAKPAVAVHFGIDPQKIADSDERITQVMDLGHADAHAVLAEMANREQPKDMSMTLNGNTLIVTDTSRHIKQIAELIQEKEAESGK